MPKDLNGAQVGMTPSNDVNNPRPDNKRGRNQFPQTYLHLTTDRYGEYSPFYWAKCERGDIQNLRSDHDLHTYTFKSPMVSKVDMVKSFIKVPMQAIYPINWEKIFTIPTQGDDVPYDVRSFFDPYRFLTSCIAVLKDGTPSAHDTVRLLLLIESITSSGSLFARFNYHFNYRLSYAGAGESYDPDDIFDIIWSDLLDLVESEDLHLESSDNNTQFGLVTGDAGVVSKRRYLEMLRSDSYVFSDDWDGVDLISSLSLDSISYVSGYNTSYTGIDGYINIEPIVSYQLACAQFGTNDFVDYIYSADLYRQNMASLVYSALSIVSFDYNGVKTLYDIFSYKVYSTLSSLITSPLSASVNFSRALSYFLNLFSYVPSLRYGDYFTGAKPRPLAVGEYSAVVNNNSVSAIDITKSIQMQRLLNRVNMVGRKLGDYLAGIFGGKLPEAPKDVPVFLAHQRFSVNGFETENTGDIQFNPEIENTITSHLRSSENRHSFDIEIDEPCYLIGMNTYESHRVYSRGIDRFAFHHDRYDDFIPEMQYIGDQDIKLAELDSRYSSLQPFGYCLRYMEYKQRPSYASGGFINNLPSWAFITDNEDGNPSGEFISPDYIRSSPSEFDRFYKSLNGYSLGSYFHFIVAHTNVTAPYRMMEYTPEILK